MKIRIKARSRFRVFRVFGELPQAPCLALLLLSGLICFLLVDARASAAGEPTDSPAISTQYGAVRHEVLIGQNKAFLVLPAKPSADGAKPWIWYAPTFLVTRQNPDQKHAWMYEQLLAAGFAIGGVDVGESYGSPAGRAIYTDYYRYVVKKYGLSPKTCMMPQSRGGLMVYNWAAEHPQWVERIGAIYAVCDMSSWPRIERSAPAYGMTAEELQKHLGEHNPIDRLAPLAGAKVPLLHLHGDVDTVVPLEQNSGELIRRYRVLGGPGELLVIHGKGHEVCPEFFQCQPLVDFFLAAHQRPD